MNASSSSSLRVGFLAAELSGNNGWARLALETVRHLARLDVRGPVLICGGTEPPNEPLVEPIARLPPWPQSPLRWPVAVAKSLPGVIRDLRECDLVHCLVEPYLPLASMAAHWLRKPLVVSAIGTYSARAIGPWTPMSPFAFWTRRASAIPCISRYTEKRVREWNPNAPTSVVNPGVDPSMFSPGPPRGLAASIQGRVIVSVGAVKPRKGHDITITALSLLPSQFDDVSLYIAGDRETHRAFADSLIALADRLGVRDRVHLLGKIAEPELINWYRRSELCLLNASNRGEHFEGFGLTLLEANACGKPIAGCHDSGAEDIIVHGDNGLLIPQDAPAAMAEAISTIFGEPSLAQTMGRRGRARACEMSWEHSARKMLDLYRRILPTS